MTAKLDYNPANRHEILGTSNTGTSELAQPRQAQRR
jgi:hypothetical protein